MSDQLIQVFQRMAREARKTDLAVFAGRVGGRLMDNAKYLFRHCVLHKQPFTPIFLTHHKAEHETLRAAKLPSMLFPSDESIQLLPRAKVVAADDFWFKTQTPAYHLLSQAKVLQMWHGIPLKLIGFPEIESGVNMTPDKAEHLRFGYSGYDAALSTSPFITKTSLGKVFQAGEMWETGYPRNDVFFRPPTKQELLGSDVELYAQARQASRKGPVFVYTPTFRDHGGLGLTPDVLDLAALDAAMGEMNGLFIMKFHSFTGVHSELPFRNIRIMRSTDDVYPLLPLTSALITDYSSIFTDYLVMDKPVLFFPYDLDDYRKKNRELQFDYDWITPGPKCMNQQELLAALADVARGGDLGFADKRREIARLAFARHDGESCARVLEHLRREIGA